MGNRRSNRTNNFARGGSNVLDFVALFSNVSSCFLSASPFVSIEMKAAYCLLVFLLVAPSLLAEDTAYTALRAVGKQLGKESLNHVIEVRGRGGAPAPDLWKVTIGDPASRGGLREIEVQHGKIVAERSPLMRVINPAMNFNQLNLDSDGVFTIANDEAKKAGLPFDKVDYTLKSGARAGAPVWEVDLFDGHNGRVATVDIAADSGAIVHRDIATQAAPPPSAPPGPYVERHPPIHDVPPPDVDSEEGQPLTGVGDFFDRVKRHIVHHFEKRRRQFENFFSGRTWSPDDSDRDRD